MLRSRAKRFVAARVLGALGRSSALEQLVGAAIDRRRLAIVLTGLRRSGTRIAVVYDIGAHRGEWTTSVRASLPGARFYLFEANGVHASELRAIGDPFFIAVLSSEEKVVDFYGTGGPGDSYYREVTDHYAGVAPLPLQATTLDKLVVTHDLPYPDFIKADVQGAELDVLRGGAKTLARANLVLLECPLVEYNEGAPDIAEYLSFMRESAFTPVAFLDPLWQRGEMIQIELLFARSSLATGSPS